ncbi:MAG TPA: cupin-like domain-containing protein, partial [Planctomycetaceae bacterium]|nr:cupin-like domain-containing protein [Planctomycetaceae bacterium]
MQKTLSTIKLSLAGLIVLPAVLACGLVGTVLSIPVFVRRMPWKLLRRPILFVLMLGMQLARMTVFCVTTLGYAGVFFGESVSADRHPRSWQLPYGLRVRYRLLLTGQRYFGMLRFQRWEQRLRDEALAWCRAHPPTFDQVHQKIPRVHADDTTPQAFFNQYVRNPHPVILTGLNAGSHAVGHWTPEYFRKYEEERAPLLTGDSDDFYSKTRFGDFLDYLRDNIDVPVDQRPLRYVANFANLCNNHPELVDELNPRQMGEWMPGAIKTNMEGVHIFMGLQGTSTVFHCANTPNWFFQVQGEKRWTFV